MKNKKLLYIALGVLVLILAGVFLVRLLTPEDTWLCKNGSWVRHGNPTAQMPKIEDCK